MCQQLRVFTRSVHLETEHTGVWLLNRDKQRVKPFILLKKGTCAGGKNERCGCGDRELFSIVNGIFIEKPHFNASLHVRMGHNLD
jgi:hypothetical protein